MTLLIVSVLCVLVVSALCSVTEAALYAVRPSYVRSLRESGSAAGRVLDRMKQNMERPISAILIINTVANTAGAALAGAQAEAVLGQSFILWFSAVFTLGVLFFSEIIPKIVGVAYSNRIAVLVAMPLTIAVHALFPLVWVIHKLAAIVKPSGPVFAAPEEEVGQMARMSAEEGSILPIEAELVQQVLKLNEVTAAEIMTPRSVVRRFPADTTLQAISHEMAAGRIKWTNARVPVTDPKNDDVWSGVVLRRDVLAHLARDEFDRTLGSLAKPLHRVPMNTPGHVLLKSFLSKRSHLFGVVNESGTVVGIVTLEDVMESLIGEEIVDEVDVVVDMQELARQWEQRPSQGDRSNPS
ncbi:CNNM domain-containing protein [Stieleria sp. ICT_E10.1]|uniref:CNNM domain-containing protein n=1 Tax=Stieleria sedimenti TaxID=2976331 RepID=UPI0021808E78|nr:CNNM domain-containing protein [Stieleria sedimenti]MCS7466803.1 CNNM domain-containing protein [Stieleria sedimenti]